MIEVILREALEDNVMPFIVSRAQKMFWCVDPGDEKVLNRFVLENPDLRGMGAFITHHHHDHIDALPRFKELFPASQIRGPQHPFLKAHLDKAPLSSNFVVTISTPGHTTLALSYFLETATEKYLFSGDTLFGAGCGRLFEGTAAQMWDSLQKLRELPSETLMVCGHEYTLRNLNFVATLGWRTEAIEWELDRVKKLRSANRSTLPRSLKLELETNPFLNADDPELSQALGLGSDSDPAETFRVLRELRNRF